METRKKYFLVLMTLHGSLLVTSTVAGSKVFSLPYGFSASATVISYMLTFVVIDTIAELYGRTYSRLVINLGLFGMAVSAAYFQVAILLPPADVWPHQHAFQTVLDSSWRIWLAGWVAYLVSQHLDVWSFLKLGEVGLGRIPLALRAWIGMLVGQFFDTFIFISIAFFGEFPLGPALIGQYVVKVMVATAGAPLVPLAVSLGRSLAPAGPRLER